MVAQRRFNPSSSGNEGGFGGGGSFGGAFSGTTPPKALVPEKPVPDPIIIGGLAQLLGELF